MRAARRLLQARVATSWPLNHRKIRRASASDMTLHASIFRPDYDRMTGAGMRLGPPVKNGSGAPLRDMPPIQSALADPISGRGDNQISCGEQIMILRDELMQITRAMFEC